LAGLFQQQQQLFQSLDAKAKALLAQQQQALARAQQAAANAAAHAASTPSVLGIPAAYLALYRAAATTCSGLNWTVLAAIGQVESGHGRSVGPSSGGAEGPMQFLPSTFDAYAVDGNGDGTTNIWDPADSIFTAAKYLCANGAGKGPQGLYNAVWRYNHADWYVQMVLNLAGEIAARFGVPAPVGVKG
jgi:membrane-bound lytic murein transglycosylase B